MDHDASESLPFPAHSQIHPAEVVADHDLALLGAVVAAFLGGSEAPAGGVEFPRIKVAQGEAELVADLVVQALMAWRCCAFPAAAAALGLAVDGDLDAQHFEAQPCEMRGDAGGENGRGDGLKDAREGVVGGDAVGELESFPQPVLAQFGELLHEFSGSHAAEQSRAAKTISSK